jgi:hypothetical protein
MTERSWFWGGTATGDAALPNPYGAPYSDDIFSDLFSAMLSFDRTQYGVILSGDSRFIGHFAISTTLSNITIQPGAAMVDGKMYISDAAITYPLTVDNTYLVYLRKDFAAQTIRMGFRTGTTVTQVDGSVWEIPLYTVVRQTISGSPVVWYVDQRMWLSNASKVLLGKAITLWNQNRLSPGYPYFNNLPNSWPSTWPFRALRLEYDGVYIDGSKTGFPSITHNLLDISINGSSSALYTSKYSLQTGTSAPNYFYTTDTTVCYAGIAGANYKGSVPHMGAGWVEFPGWNTNETQKMFSFEGYTNENPITTIRGQGWFNAAVPISSFFLFTDGLFRGGEYDAGRFLLYGLM